MQVRKSFFAELGIFDDEALTQQVYHDFILGEAGERLQQAPDDDEDDDVGRNLDISKYKLWSISGFCK